MLKVRTVSGTADTGESLLRALNAEGAIEGRADGRENGGRDRVELNLDVVGCGETVAGRAEEGLEVRCSVVKVDTVGRSGTAGTALNKWDDMDGTAGTGSKRREENLGWSANCCLKMASSSLARSNLKLWTCGEGNGSLGSLAKTSLPSR